MNIYSSYEGFDVTVESEEDDDPSYSWCVKDEEHVFRCGSAEDSGSAWTEATRWVDSYLKALPKTKDAEVAKAHLRILKDADEALEKLIQEEYLKHNERIVRGGLKDRFDLLVNAHEIIKEAMEISGREIRAIGAFPDETLEDAIRMYLRRNYG